MSDWGGFALAVLGAVVLAFALGFFTRRWWTVLVPFVLAAVYVLIVAMSNTDEGELSHYQVVEFTASVLGFVAAGLTLVVAGGVFLGRRRHGRGARSS